MTQGHSTLHFYLLSAHRRSIYGTPTLWRGFRHTKSSPTPCVGELFSLSGSSETPVPTISCFGANISRHRRCHFKKRIAFQNKKSPRGIGEISDAFLDEKIIWKYPINLSKPIVSFEKICYNWINPKNVDDTYRRAVLWQERNNRPCSGRKS